MDDLQKIVLCLVFSNNLHDMLLFYNCSCIQGWQYYHLVGEGKGPLAGAVRWEREELTIVLGKLVEDMMDNITVFKTIGWS